MIAGCHAFVVVEKQLWQELKIETLVKMISNVGFKLTVTLIMSAFPTTKIPRKKIEPFSQNCFFEYS